MAQKMNDSDLVTTSFTVFLHAVYLNLIDEDSETLGPKCFNADTPP